MLKRLLDEYREDLALQNTEEDPITEDVSWDSIHDDFANCDVGIVVEAETEDVYTNSDFFWYDSPPDKWCNYG